jgi:hypothetical protein
MRNKRHREELLCIGGPHNEPGGQSGAHQRSAAVDDETPANPGGLPKKVFEGLDAQIAANRSVFLLRFRIRAVLWIQPARDEAIPGNYLELVAPGHDGRRERPV